MTVGECMGGMRRRLAPKVGEREATAMVRFIFSQLKGWSLTDIAFHNGDELSDYMADKCNKVVDRVLADEPIQYVLESAPFYGMDFKVTPAVLIPRPETAELVDMIVADADGRADLRVLDLGTGSGCIAIALARNLRFPIVSAVDISADALAVGRENAAKLKARINFIEADMLSLHPTESYDIIVSNPPYIADCEAAEMEPHVLNHEPHQALFVPDNDPLRFYQAIARIAQASLRSGGRIYLEINPIYAKQMSQMLTETGFADVAIHKDAQGRDRFATAVAK